jgi:hypothetical protein
MVQEFVRVRHNHQVDSPVKVRMIRVGSRSRWESSRPRGLIELVLFYSSCNRPHGPDSESYSSGRTLSSSQASVS